MTRTITAYFDTRTEAQNALDQLAQFGITEANATIHDGTSSGNIRSAEGSEQKGFFESIGDFFMPDEDRYTYEEGIRRGGSVLTVRADDADFDRVSDILEQSGSVDLDARESEWRSEGWSGYDATAAGQSSAYTRSGETGYADTGRATADYGTASVSGSEDYIPVAEESLRVGKREVEHGRVRIRSYVVETPVEENVSLREERVTLERNAVDRPASAADHLFEDRTLEVSESAEEAIVSKDTRVVEEVRLNKDVVQRDETISDTVRRTEVEVEDERTGATSSSMSDDEIARQRRGA